MRAEVLSSRGAVPQALIERHAKWITNRPETLGTVNLIKAVVRNLGVEKAVADQVQNVNPVTRRLTPEAQERLAKLGVRSAALPAADVSCRDENRPSDTKGNGGGRPFIPWCSRGKK